jgi:hypothetical protein
MTQPANPDLKKLHYNVPQLMFYMVMAQTSVNLWGRATGKSEGPMAMFTRHNVLSMPRSNGFLLGTTYEQLLTRTLPPLIAGLEKLGFYQDVHFSIRKFLPDRTLHKAYRYPQKADNYIHFFNGSGIYLVSQDRPGTINGVRTQWGAGDEARLLDYTRVQEEVMPTMAGHADLFGHLSSYLSLLYCSDMPRTSKARWLLDFEKEMDPKTIEAILILNIQVIKLQENLLNASASQVPKLRRQIRELEQDINDLRKGTTYFSLASTLDNIHTLGMDVIKNLVRILTDIEFSISVLNERILKVERNFYHMLNEQLHGYDMVNYDYVDGLDIDYSNPPAKDCRWDADINLSQPLDIAMDYNNSINSIVTGQYYENELRFLSSQFVLHPQLLSDAVQQWHNYYCHHPVRVVNYYYDHTAKEKRANSNEGFCDQVTDQLEKLGWTVMRIDLGHTPAHKYRYELWGKLFTGRDPRLPRFRYNRTNCAAWQISCEQCSILQQHEETKKDKRPEKDPSFPQEEAPHLSDAGDTLMWGRIRDKVGRQTSFIEELIS